MPPSQLKRLKTALRDRGIVGQQQSKKQKKRSAQLGIKNQNRLTREAALTEIREQLNPFEYQNPTRNQKFEVISQDSARVPLKRLGLNKSRDEDTRRNAYLMDQGRKKKVGGIIDKRFGESDPTLTPEEKMLQRFIREKQIRHKSHSNFNLEENEISEELTHAGRPLSFDKNLVDDFEEDDLTLYNSDLSSHPADRTILKRIRTDDQNETDSLDEHEGHEGQPLRKKSKQEVMRELIAKSKIFKYERQAAKDEDEDLRKELDNEMPGIYNLLREIPSKPVAKSEPSHSLGKNEKALQPGIHKTNLDKDYDMQLGKMIHDKRSQPTEKSLSEEELAAQRVKRLQELESERLRRMQGVTEENDHKSDENNQDGRSNEEDEDFGFGSGIKVRSTNTEIGVEDEDEFFIEDDLIASESENENLITDDSSSDVSTIDLSNADNSDDTTIGEKLKVSQCSTNEDSISAEKISDDSIDTNIAYQFACPQSQSELLEITRDLNLFDLPTVVRRIRILYDPKLGSENKKKLGNFSVALVDHISYLANQQEKPPIVILESLIRHVHSLAKTFPVEISEAFRAHISSFNSFRALCPTAGDLVILTAIGIIFPTSDHFHQVVTPALLSIGRYLGLKTPECLHEHAIGSYLCTLCLLYQSFSKRYIPEVINFIQNSLCILAPVKIDENLKDFPYHKSKLSLRIKGAIKCVKKPEFFDFISQTIFEEGEQKEAMKVSLLEADVKILETAVDTWKDKEAFCEVFQPSFKILQHLSSTPCSLNFPESTKMALQCLIQKLELLQSLSQKLRRPLELHHHRPLAIKTSIPKFEESFNPDRHYDPDETRTERAKLKKEHKREKKGAIRELRKDAKTYAIQNLKEKKERDAAYEKKYRRLIAEIQGEEGKEAKAYEREKEWRKKSRK